jgi:tetratricopeptide (TPR) repeat protein
VFPFRFDMRRALATIAILASLALRPAVAMAATPTEFYASLLQRGVNAFNAGRYEDAARNLRLAAFGYVEALPQYQTAQVYLALASDRLGDAERARESARRVVAAERVARTWWSLTLPPATRDAFQSLAARVLSPTELATLNAPAPVAVTPPAQTTAVPTTPAMTGTNGPATAPDPIIEPLREPVMETPRTEPQPPPQADPPPVASPTLQPPRQTVVAPRPVVDVTGRLAAAERALSTADLEGARRIYGELLALDDLTRDALLRVAEGSYRARDFARALEAFGRIGTLQDAERPYRYYVAVALYETGEYAEAKRELASALPFIEITPDVARYRAKIEGAVN